MSLDQSWFTEAYESCGSAFSLKVVDKLHELGCRTPDGADLK